MRGELMMDLSLDSSVHAGSVEGRIPQTLIDHQSSWQAAEDLTSDCNIDRIDFLSIDVEGAEHGVLKSMDWTLPIYIVAVELDDEGIDDKASHQLLLQHGLYFSKVGLSKDLF